MPCRGVRGATTIQENEREEILTATRQLLALMIRRNGLEHQDVASAIFTTTPDINAEFPALAARQLGWLEVPLLSGHEMAVVGSIPLCIRVLDSLEYRKEPGRDTARLHPRRQTPAARSFQASRGRLEGTGRVDS